MFEDGCSDKEICKELSIKIEIVRKRRYNMDLMRDTDYSKNDASECDIEFNRQCAEFSRRSSWLPSQSSLGWAG